MPQATPHCMEKSKTEHPVAFLAYLRGIEPRNYYPRAIPNSVLTVTETLALSIRHLSYSRILRERLVCPSITISRSAVAGKFPGCCEEMPKVVVCELRKAQLFAGCLETFAGVFDWADGVAWLRIIFLLQSHQQLTQFFRHRNCARGRFGSSAIHRAAARRACGLLS